jgi:hypothetical protein
MKRMLLGGLAAAALLFAGSAVRMHAQVVETSPQKLEFSVNDLNGFPVHGETTGASGMSYTAAVSVTAYERHSVMRRLFLDKNNHLAFGYMLEAYQVEGQPAIHLHFVPLTSTESFAGVDTSEYKMVSMQLPPDQDAAVNQPVDVPLEVNDNGDRMLRERLVFGPPKSLQ